MFEAARAREWPEIFESELLARNYIADAEIIGARPWIRWLGGSISGSFIVISGKDVKPKVCALNTPVAESSTSTRGEAQIVAIQVTKTQRSTTPHLIQRSSND
jgi:hypothetical protein